MDNNEEYKMGRVINFIYGYFKECRMVTGDAFEGMCDAAFSAHGPLRGKIKLNRETDRMEYIEPDAGPQGPQGS